jgi:hypothetical protein
MVWHASPRWAAVKGNDRTLVKQDPQAKFKAAQAKAAKVGLKTSRKRTSTVYTSHSSRSLGVTKLPLSLVTCKWATPSNGQ